jgi:hypothetical protein
MSSCKEVKSRAYQTRKSPAYHAGDCKGQTKKGKNGIYISAPDKRGVYSWRIKRDTRKKNRGSSNMAYEIHWNGLAHIEWKLPTDI